ncbi:MAG: DUF3372 domain-containing protein [Clostridium sp.]|nr:DUF3372 domain-containing protein [Clostridium sp.]
MKMHRMANAAVLTSQGIPFIHAGSEFYRTKDGDHNSYKSPDSINQLDWSRKESYMDNVDYFKGLITMRKEHPAFRMETAEEIRNNVSFMDLEEEHLVGYTLDGSSLGDSWGEITVLLNGGEDSSTFNLDANTYQIMVNGESAGLTPLDSFEGETVEVPGKTLMVLIAGDVVFVADDIEPTESDN